MSDGEQKKLHARWLFRQDQSHLCWGRCLSALYDRMRKRVEMMFESGREVVLCFAHSPADSDLDFERAEIITVQLRVPLKSVDAFVYLPIDIDGMRKKHLTGAQPVGDDAEDDCGFEDSDQDTVVAGRASIGGRNKT